MTLEERVHVLEQNLEAYDRWSDVISGILNFHASETKRLGAKVNRLRKRVKALEEQ